MQTVPPADRRRRAGCSSRSQPARKELVWLGSQNQMQFYEDPVTIDQAVPLLSRFFVAAAAAA